MNFNKLCCFTALLIISISSAMASDFLSIPESATAHVKAIAPVFDFDGDACLPSAAVSRSGVKNGGLAIGGDVTGQCRRNDFMNYSNTYHRSVCKGAPLSSGAGWASVVRYCAHMYALYFKKDQVMNHGLFIATCSSLGLIGGAICQFANQVNNGHRHDVEFVIVYTRNNAITHASYSSHGSIYTNAWRDIQKDANGHLKFVYHKSGATHPLRLANTNEAAENPAGSFVTPSILSWNTMTGTGVTNAQMQQKLNTFDYGTADMHVNDARFLNNVNSEKPSYYPTF